MAVGLDPRIGTELAGYRLESVVGRGGMGVVYLAQDLRLKRRVALKLVAPELAADPRFRERFLRESELAASLDHSHVVPVYAAGETDGQLWIAMRYVEGEDLATLLARERPLEPARAVDLCAQVGEALDAAHASGLVHRDVKPANVLVTREEGKEHAYLSDFGLARDQEAAPDTQTHLSGTVDYTAPEQIANEPAEARADVYSLGCVLYECLAGEPPFERSRPIATLFAHVSEEPPSLHERRPELPAAIDGVIAKALAKSPDDRFQTCGELCVAAREALGLEAAPRFSRRALLLGAGGVALAAAAAAAVPAILLGRDGGSATAESKPIVPLGADGVVRVDPATRRPIAAVATGSGAGALGVGDGAVWVLDTGTRGVVQIDATSNRVVGRVEPEEPARATSIAADAGAVWLLTVNYTTDFRAAQLWRYEPRSSSYVPWEGDTKVSGLAIGLGSVWATNWEPAVYPDGFLNRIEPASGASESRVRGPWGADEVLIALGDAAIWTAHRNDPGFNGHTLVRFDPETSSIVGTFPLDFAVSDLAVGEGAVWVTHSDADAIARVDAATGRVTNEVRVGRGPERLTTGAGALWATSRRDGTLTRVDPATFDIETIDVGGPPNDVDVGSGSVWAAVGVQ